MVSSSLSLHCVSDKAGSNSYLCSRSEIFSSLNFIVCFNFFSFPSLSDNLSERKRNNKVERKNFPSCIYPEETNLLPRATNICWSSNKHTRAKKAQTWVACTITKVFKSNASCQLKTVLFATTVDVLVIWE